MHNMFIYSSNLKTLNLSSFRTSQITDLYQTFHQNSSLEYLDIRNANFINVTDYEHAFDGIKNNVTIIVKDDANKKWVEDRLQEVGRSGNVIVAY